MSCFPELTYHIFADGELPAEQARTVEAHLAACARCRELVAALRAENVLLAAAVTTLEDEPEAALAAAPLPGSGRLLDLAWTTLAVLVAAAGLQVAADWFSDQPMLAGMDWLNPFNLAVQMNLAFSSLFYLIREGADMLISTFTTVSAVILGALVLGASVVLVRRRFNQSAALLVALAIAFGLAQPAEAFEKRVAKHESIVIPKDQVLDDTLAAFGENIVVDGTITGNLLAFGRSVEVNGTVKGDVLAFGEGVRITGTVEGNVFVFTRGLDLSGRVGQSVYVWSESANLPSGSQVKGDLLGFARGLNMDGAVGRDVMALAGGINVSGTIGRNLTAQTGKLSVMSGARIGGNLQAQVEKEKNVRIDPGATVAGRTEIKFPEPQESPYRQLRFYLHQAVGLTIGFLLGLLLFRLFPVLFAARLDSASAMLRAAGIGFLALVATPVAAVVLAALLCGVGVLAGAVPIFLLFPILITVAWLLSMYLAKIFVASLLGQALLRSPAGQPPQFAVPLLAGLAVTYVAINIPYFGAWIHFLIILLGLGILVSQGRQLGRRPTAV